MADRKPAEPSTRKLDLRGIGRDAEAPSAPRASLVVLHGPESDLGLHVPLVKPVVIGRDPLSDLPLHAEGISRRHCSVTPEGDGYFVEDLGSTNGTFVGGERLSGKRRLEPGDRLYVGHAVLKFTADEVELGFYARMDELAGSDHLTGLPAKRRFDAALLRAVEEAARSGKSLALLAIDLDHLKQINDRHGHPVGAHTISEVGRLLGETVGTLGLACRFGGDEFFAYLLEHDTARAVAFGERLRARLAAHPIEKDGAHIRATVSIGVASFPAVARDADELMRLADDALYRAKRAGRDRVST